MAAVFVTAFTFYRMLLVLLIITVIIPAANLSFGPAELTNTSN